MRRVWGRGRGSVSPSLIKQVQWKGSNHLKATAHMGSRDSLCYIMLPLPRSKDYLSHGNFSFEVKPGYVWWLHPVDEWHPFIFLRLEVVLCCANDESISASAAFFQVWTWALAHWHLEQHILIQHHNIVSLGASSCINHRRSMQVICRQIGARTNGRHILCFEFNILDENLEVVQSFRQEVSPEESTVERFVSIKMARNIKELKYTRSGSGEKKWDHTKTLLLNSRFLKVPLVPTPGVSTAQKEQRQDSPRVAWWDYYGLLLLYLIGKIGNH